MFEHHIDSVELRKKIDDLFNYREFPLLLESIYRLDLSSASDLYEKLVKLQTSIYHLDAHLEANWVTDPSKLAFHWHNITSDLVQFGIKKENVGNYLTWIKKYEKHELELRQYKSPLRLSMNYFYFYKSCDVKLLRRLIHENIPQSTMAKNIDWRWFDMVTEVNDDISDVFEDLEFINGNRFLISIIVYGKKETKSQFIHFLNSIQKNAYDKWKSLPKLGFQELIYNQTCEQIQATQLLLQTQLETINQSDLNHSKLNKTFFARQKLSPL